jgi:hypothetical protein
MRFHRSTIFAILVAAALGVLPASADSCGSALVNVGPVVPGSSDPFTGCFGVDNDEQAFSFSLESPDLLNLSTGSWATGGFSPVLTLFDAGGNQIAVDHGGVNSVDPSLNTCGSRGVGTADGESTCLDAFISTVLAPGDYTLVLTEAGNCAGCGNLSTGNYTGFPDPNYAQYQHPHFTGFEWHGSGSTSNFLSPNNGQPLGSTWSVEIVDVAPEPAAWFTGVSGLLSLLLIFRYRKPVRGAGGMDVLSGFQEDGQENEQ